MSRLDDILKVTFGRIRLPNGRIPIDEWLEQLDVPVRARIAARLRRLSAGNFGDCKNLGNGVSELRMSFGSGYRVYYGHKSKEVVLLICGGDKRSQTSDIKKAKHLWAKYLQSEIDVLMD